MNTQATQEVFHTSLGRSPAAQEILERAMIVAKTDAPILITGESGTGKSTLAQEIHAASHRSAKPFIHVNCAAIPESLLESELFGHVKGAFTGAESHKKGLFELAHGGTLFLDEISEFSLSAQSKLLLALQEGEIRPLGAQTSAKLDVRIISASNKDLRNEIKQGNFREDLYYRLEVAMLRCLPLRERTEDIPHLVEILLAKLALSYQLPLKKMSDEVIAAFQAYCWPGNIREMSNLLGHILIFGSDPVQLHELPEKLRPRSNDGPLKSIPNTSPEGLLNWQDYKDQMREQLKQHERDYLLKVLAISQGNVSEAARILGVRRTTLYKWFAIYGIDSSALHRQRIS